MMAFFSSIRKKVQISKVPEAFRRSGTALLDFLLHSDDAGKKIRRGVAGMVKAVLASAETGEISNAHWTILRDFADHFSPSDSITLLKDIQDAQPLTPEKAADLLQEIPRPEKEKLVLFLLALSQADDQPMDRLEMVELFAEKIGFSREEIAQMLESVRFEKNKRRQLLRSGTGVLIVLGIIVIFLLMATWLRPVAFGLLLAYLLLPLEKFFERRLREKRGIGHCVFGFFHILSLPLQKLSKQIKRKLPAASEESPSAEDEEKEKEKRLIGHAVMETSFLFVLVIALITALFSYLAFAQLHTAGKQFGAWMMRGESVAADGTTTSPFKPAIEYLDRTKDKFARLPRVRSMIESASDVLENPQKMQQMCDSLLKRSGGAFSVTTGVLGGTLGFVADLLLTLFFAIFFLTKLAEFCRRDESTGKQGEYLVRSLYNGKWLPGAQEAALSEATRLIGGMLVRLRIWIRGYLTLILIDMTVFTLFFGLFGLPHFLILGLIAGCSQLLPYIGPILTAGITLIVTLACGGSGSQIMLIVVFYLIYNGIIEQFITYPAIIGDSLGLTTLETIIVVLLGAVVAGIPGMLLAMPTASVAKYLVPQIYRCLEIRRTAVHKETN